MSSFENSADFGFDEDAVLNDPELLQELNQLMGIEAPKVTKPVQKVSVPSVPIAVPSTSETLADVEDVEIHDHELPDLMAELNSLSLQDPTVKSLPSSVSPPVIKKIDKEDLPSKPPVEVKPNSSLISVDIPKPVPSTKSVSVSPAAVLLPSVPQVPAKVKQNPQPVKVNTQPAPVIKSSPAETRNSESPTSLVANLKDLLQKQIDTCTKLASDYYKIGKKDEALYFHKYKKQFTMDQSLLTADSKFERISILYNQISVNWDIPLDKLQLSVNSITQNMNDISGGSFYIHIDSPFSQAPIDSPTIKSIATTPLYQNMYPIESTKTYQRYFEKKKVVLEYYMPRFLRSAVFLGKCSIELIELLRKCSVSGSYQLMDQSGRRGIGVYCDVSIKLHKPLVKPFDMEEVRETWVIMNEPAFYSYILDTEKLQVQVKEQPNSASSVSNISSKTGTPQKATSPTPNVKPATPVSVKATPSKTNTSSSNIDLEDLILQFKSYQSNSNNVLENLLTQFPANSSESEGIKLALNVLVVQVQTGALTIEKYVGMLQDESKAWKQFALNFKRAGNLEYAKKALERVKIVEAEISSAQNVE